MGRRDRQYDEIRRLLSVAIHSLQEVDRAIATIQADALTTNTEPNLAAAGSKLLLTVTEAAGLLSVSRTNLYKLVQRGDIRSIQLGRSRRIPTSELARFVEEELNVVS